MNPYRSWRGRSCWRHFSPCAARVLFIAAMAAIGMGQRVAASADAWVELKAPHFTVWSEASESKTRAWAVEFELFRRGMAQLIPVNEQYVAPATILLFRSDRRIRSYMPLDHGQPAKVSGFSSRRYDRTLIAVSLEGARDDVRDVVYGASLYWHLGGVERTLPTWLEMGLSEVFTTFVLHGNACDIGADRNSLYRYVRVAGSLPFSEILPLEAEDMSFAAGSIDRTRQIRSQCWVATQALLFTKEGIGWEAFRTYLSQPSAAGTPDEGLEQAFGLNAAALDQRLAAYLDHGKSERVTAPLDRTGVEEGFRVRKLAAWEEDLALGSLLTSAHRLDEAEARLARAFLAAPDDAGVHEARALLALAKDDYAEAGREAEAALRAGNDTFFNHYLVANAALQGGAGDPETTPEIVRQLVACLGLNPRFEPAYALLGRAAFALKPGDTKAADLLLVGGDRYGGSFYVQTGSAVIAARRGDAGTARRHLATAKALAGSADSRRGKYAAEVARIVRDELSPMNAGLARLRRLSDEPVVQMTFTPGEGTPAESLRRFVAALDTAIAREPDASLHYLRSLYKLWLQDHEGAMADAAEASRLAPTMMEAHLVAGEAKLARLNFAGAIGDFDAVLAAQPDNARVHARRAYVKFRSGDAKAGLSGISRAIELDPGTAQYYSDRGYMRRTVGDDPAALVDFNRAIELDPGMTTAYLNRGAIRAAKGDRAGAAEDFARVAAPKATAK